MKRGLKRKLSFVTAFLLAFVLASASVVYVPQGSKVAEAAKKYKLSVTKLSMNVGDTSQLKVINANSKTKIKWSSSKKSVATVSGKGKVTAKAAGTAIITAKIKSKSLKCTVEVVQPVSDGAFADVATFIEENGTPDDEGDMYIDYSNNTEGVSTQIYYYDKKIEFSTYFDVVLDDEPDETYCSHVTIQVFEDGSGCVVWALEKDGIEYNTSGFISVKDISALESVDDLDFNNDGNIPGMTFEQGMYEMKSFLEEIMDMSLADFGFESFQFS